MNRVILPELGEGIEKAVVACWHVKESEHVQQGEDIVELVTDKATFHVTAETSGRLKAIFVLEGQEAKIGETLAIIEP